MIMVPRSRSAMTMRTLRHSREPLWFRVGFELPLQHRRLDGRLRSLGGARRQALAVDAKEGPRGRKGSVTPLRCVNVGP